MGACFSKSANWFRKSPCSRQSTIVLAAPPRVHDLGEGQSSRRGKLAIPFVHLGLDVSRRHALERTLAYGYIHRRATRAGFGQSGAVTNMSEAIITQKAPYEVELKVGKKYAWCRCGLSSRQPFCDGSHSTTDIEPLVFTAEEAGTHWLCGCKHTAGQPFCDGTHGKL